MRLWIWLLLAASLTASGHSASGSWWSRVFGKTRPAPSTDIQVFIHVHCAQHWTTILEEQFHALMWSGLLERVSAVHVVINELRKSQALGEAANLTRIYGSKVRTTFYFNDASYERLTLYSIRQHITPQTRFLYMHSKGVTHETENLKVRFWRQYMEYFLIRHWEACVCMLDSGEYDTVGVNLRLNPPWPWPPHYNGNFWWATGEWWLSINQVIGGYYWDPEFHLLAGLPDPKHKPRAAFLAESAPIDHDPYRTQIKPKDYAFISNWTMAEAVGCKPRDVQTGLRAQ